MKKPNGTTRTRLDGTTMRKYIEMKKESQLVDTDGLLLHQCPLKETEFLILTL